MSVFVKGKGLGKVKLLSLIKGVGQCGGVAPASLESLGETGGSRFSGSSTQMSP